MKEERNLNPIKIIKANPKEMIYLLCLYFEIYFLCPNLILYVLCIIVSTILSFLFLSKTNIEVTEISKRNSAYHFIYSLSKSMYENINFKQAYEISCRYLISYQDTIPFEEILEDKNLNLYEFQSYFDLLVSKEKENQSNLLNTFPLMEESSLIINKIEEKEKKIKHNSLISMAITISMLFLLILSFQFVLDKSFLSKFPYSLIFAFLSTILSPCLFICQYLQYRKYNNA